MYLHLLHPKMPSNIIYLYKDVIKNREANNLDIINFIPIEKAFKIGIGGIGLMLS